MYTIPLEQLTDDELSQHYTQLLERERLVVEEQKRRQALPHIWENENKIVADLRAAGISSYEEGAPFKEPKTIVDAYVEGDVVEYNGELYQAVGRGAIYHAPGTVHPIMGDRWVVYADEEA